MYNVFSAHLVVEKRSGDSQPPIDGHQDHHTTGAQVEGHPQLFLPAQPHAIFDYRPRACDDGHDRHAGQRQAIDGGQATQQENVSPICVVVRDPAHDE